MHNITVFACKLPKKPKGKLVRKIGQALLFYGSKSLGKEPGKILRGEKGKPYMEGNPYFFNISHSGEVIILGISDIPLGVDVQKLVVGKEKIAQRFFHKKEWEFLTNAPEDSRDYLFTKLWTMKESYVKMTGEGLSAGLGSFNVLDKELPVHFETGRVFSDYVFSLCEKEPFGYEIRFVDRSEFWND